MKPLTKPLKKTLRKIILSLVGILVLYLAFATYNMNRAPRIAIGQTKTAIRDDATLGYHLSGHGELIVLIPSVGRAAEDFNELVVALNRAHYRTLAIDPRGMGASGSIGEKPKTLHDLAKDIEAIVAQVNPNGPIVVLGHAFGNRLARTYSVDFPKRVRAVILLAAGGKIEIEPKAANALKKSFYTFMPDVMRRNSLEYAFFAPGHSAPENWMRGWSIRTALMQKAALKETPYNDWWSGGLAPMLIVQASFDKIAPAEHTSVLLKKEFPERVTVVNINHAGHAMLPEQPEAIANAIITYLGSLPK